MLLQQKCEQMCNNLAEQQQQSKIEQCTQEQLSSPLPQFLKTYDFGNY